MELLNTVENQQVGTSSFLDGRYSHSLTDVSLASTVPVASSLDGKHEPRSDVPSPFYTQEEGSYRFTSLRKPVPSTASLPTITAASADAPLLTPASQSRRRIISKRGSNWNWEFFALFFSFSSMAAMVALLAYVNGRPLAQWNGILSLNALVSTLGAISRTSMGFAISSCLAQAKWNWFKRRTDTLITFDRFDEASRGPWGSLWLVIWLRASHWVVVGAIVTIILIGFEPFLQAVISYSGEMDPSTTSRAHIGRSEVIDIGLYFDDATSSPFVIPLPNNASAQLLPYKYLADLGMLSAFNSGIYSAYITGQTTAFVCPTANCTWPTFTSLAVCSACSDVASYLQASKQEGSNLGTSTQSHVNQFYGNYTTYYLPRLNITNISESSGSNLTSAYMAATIITDPRLTLSFDDLTTMITAVQVIRAAEGYEAGELIWDDTPLSATECALYFCVNAYQSVVDKGILKEHIVSSWAERDFSSYRDIRKSKDFDLFDKWNNYSFYIKTGDFARTDLELFIPEEDVKKYGLSDDMVARFHLTQRTVGSTTHFVNEELLNSSMIWPAGDFQSQLPAAQTLYRSEDLSATFDKIAWSVSDWIRDISNITQEGIGEEWTRRLHLDPWKTDMVATLTYSVDAETRAQLRHADRNGYLEKSIKAMTAKFEDVGCGLELRTQQT